MIDQKQLQVFQATLQKYRAGKAGLERRVVAAENWWKLRNRAEERRMGLSDDPADFKSVSGWLHNVIVSKHADAMDAFPEPAVLPREPGDAAEAAMLSAVIPCILEQNRFERVYDLAQWQKLKTGTAAYRVVWDPDRHGGLGDIAVERVDLLDLFWEPGVDDIQKSRYVFYTRLEDEDLLCEQYPQLRGKLRGGAFRPARWVYDEAVDLSGKQTVVEVYYKKDGVLHYCKYVGDNVLYATENQAGAYTETEPSEAGPFRKGRAAERASFRASPKARRYGACEDAVTDEGEARSAPSSVGCADIFPPEGGRTGEVTAGLYAHGRYPFVLDPLFPVEGSPCGYGFVDLCRSTQTAIDLMRTAFVKNTMVGATPRYFQRLDGSVNEEEFTDLSRALVHVSGNLGEDSLRQIRLEPMSGTYLGVLQSTIAELRETSGNTETSAGVVHSGVTAASAIAALQEASGKGSRDASRASYLAFAEIVELIIELIRQFYDLPRQFRITGQGGASFLRYSNAGLLARAVEGEELTLPVFDVKVSAQKRSAYSRLSQNELALQLYRLGIFEPGREQQANECLELMDFDGRDELLRRLDALGKLRARIDALERDKALMLTMLEKWRNGARPDEAAEEVLPPAGGKMAAQPTDEGGTGPRPHQSASQTASPAGGSTMPGAELEARARTAEAAV